MTYMSIPLVSAACSSRVAVFRPSQNEYAAIISHVSARTSAWQENNPALSAVCSIIVENICARNVSASFAADVDSSNSSLMGSAATRSANVPDSAACQFFAELKALAMMLKYCPRSTQ